MTYLKYFLIVSWHIFGKIVGLFWFYVAILFRKYSRNSMYNYILSNKIYLKRLNERPIVEYSNYWLIKPYHGTQGGYIKKRTFKVSKLEFILNFLFIWSFLDDDANEDTFDRGYNETFKSGERKFPIDFNCEKTLYGNSFDLGDVRGENPAFCFWGSTLWNIRNTFQNAKYLTYEISEEDWKTGKYFYYNFKGFEFGWVPFDGTDLDKQGRLAFLKR